MSIRDLFLIFFSPGLGCREAGRAHARVGLAVLGQRLEDAFRGGRCLVKAARLVCTSWDVRTLLCAHSCRAEGLAVRLLRACVARVAWLLPEGPHPARPATLAGRAAPHQASRLLWGAPPGQFEDVESDVLEVGVRFPAP